MKKGIFLSAALMLSLGAFAQPSFTRGNSAINLGVGLLNYMSYSTVVPPVCLSYEYGILDHLFDERSSLAVGGDVAFGKSRYAWRSTNDSFNDRYTHITVSLRGVLHYYLLPNLDTYGGAALGYHQSIFARYTNDIKTSSSRNDVELPNLFWPGIFVGARYFFVPAFGVFTEMGYSGLSAIQLGISFKF